MHTKKRETRSITPTRKDLLHELLMDNQPSVWPHPLEQQAMVKLMWQYLDDTGGSVLLDLSLVLRILANRMLIDITEEDRQKTFGAYMSIDYLFQFFHQLHLYRLEPEME